MKVIYIVEFLFFVLAFLISVYIAFLEGFKRKNIALLVVLGVVIGTNGLVTFPTLLTSWVDNNWQFIQKVTMLVEAALYILLYVFILSRKRFRRFLIIQFFVFLVLVLVEISWIHPLHEMLYPSYSFVFGSLTIEIAIMLFFYEQLKMEGASNIFRSFWFWISAGLFLFLVTEIPLIAVLNLLFDESHSYLVDRIQPIYEGKYVQSFIYYSTYIIGLLCRTRT